MLVDKSLLLEQINNTIKNNLVKKTICSHTQNPQTSPLESSGTNVHKMLFDHDLSFTLIKKLEERIEGLEELNDHLLYFIHFLFENFSDLVKDILAAYRQADDINNGLNRQMAQTVEYDILSSRGEKVDPIPTKRELEILELLVKGLCAKEIANLLCISETTVITHKKNLKEKFQAKNCAELISKAFAIPKRTNHAGFQELRVIKK